MTSERRGEQAHTLQMPFHALVWPELVLLVIIDPFIGPRLVVLKKQVIVVATMVALA